MEEKAAAVFELQQMLRTIAKTDENIFSIIPDGIFGEETERSVKSFQQKLGEEETGKVDFLLWEKIRNEHKKALFDQSPPLALARISNDDFPLTVGDDNPATEKLNIILRDLSSEHSNFPEAEKGTAFTEKTKSGVVLWQKIIAREQTGEVDKFTWNTLGEYYLLL